MAVRGALLWRLLCSFGCACVYTSMDAGRRTEPRRLRFNPRDSQVDEERRCCCAKFPKGGLQSLRTQETEMMQTGNAHRQRVCKVCLEETGPCVAITKSGVSATTNERSHRMFAMKAKKDRKPKALERLMHINTHLGAWIDFRGGWTLWR